MGSRIDAIMVLIRNAPESMTAKELTAQLVPGADRWTIERLAYKTRDCLRRLERYGFVVADRTEHETRWSWYQ